MLLLMKEQPRSWKTGAPVVLGGLWAAVPRRFPGNRAAGAPRPHPVRGELQAGISPCWQPSRWGQPRIEFPSLENLLRKEKS